MKVDVIIPTYKPEKEFAELIHRLQQQTYAIRKIIIINTETGIFPEKLETEPYPIEVIHIKPKDFDHGGTRNMGASISKADIVLYITQDAHAHWIHAALLSYQERFLLVKRAGLC